MGFWNWAETTHVTCSANAKRLRKTKLCFILWSCKISWVFERETELFECSVPVLLVIRTQKECACVHSTVCEWHFISDCVFMFTFWLLVDKWPVNIITGSFHGYLSHKRLAAVKRWEGESLWREMEALICPQQLRIVTTGTQVWRQWLCHPKQKHGKD